MAGNIRSDEIQLRVVIDGTPARAELANLSKDAILLRQEQQRLMQQEKDLRAEREKHERGSAEYKRLTEDLVRVRGEMKANTTAIGDNLQRQEALRKEIGATGLSLKELQARAASLRAQLRVMVPGTEDYLRLEKDLKEVNERVNELTGSAARTQRVWESMRQGIQLSQMTMGQLELEINRLRTALRDMAPNDPRMATLRTQLKQTEEQLERTRQGVSRFGLAWNELRSSTLGALGIMGGIATAVYGVVRALGDGLGRIMDFEKALSRVKALGGEYAEAIGQIRQASVQMAVEWGISSAEAARAVENLAKAGVSAKDILQGGLQGALTLAKAGNMEVAEAAEIAAKAMVQFRLSGDQIPHLADLLAAGAANASGEVKDMGDALKQSGVVLAQFGVPVEEAVGGLTAFASAGLIGSDAGTSLRTMLLRLADPSKEAANAMQEIGLQAYDAQGRFVGLAGIAEQLKRGLEGLTEAERSKALATIFGTDAVRAANVLYQQGREGLEKYTAAVNDSGFANRVAAEQMNNLSGDVDRLKGAWDGFVQSLETGDGIISSTLRTLVSGIAGALNLLSGADSAKYASFTEMVQKEYTALGGTLKLTAEKGTALTESFRNSVKAAREYGNTVEDVSMIEAARNLVIERSRELDQRYRLERRTGTKQLSEDERIELAASKAAIEELSKQLIKRRSVIADAAAAAEKAKNEAAAEEERKAKEEAERTAKEKATQDAAATDRALRALEEQARLLAEKKEALYQATLSDDERAIRQLDVKHSKERDAMLAANAEAVRLELLSQEEAAARLRDLETQQMNERVNLIEEQGNRRALAAEEAGRKVLEAEQRAKEQVYMDQLSAEDQAITRELQRMDEWVAIYEAAGLDVTEVVRRTEQNILNMRKRFRSEEERLAAEARVKRIQEQVAIYQGVGSALAGVNALMGAAYEASGQANYQNTMAAKALGLAQIAISSGVGVANAIAQGAGAGPFPANLAAIATGVGAVLSGIAQAVALLNRANVSQPSFSGNSGGRGGNQEGIVQLVPTGAQGLAISSASGGGVMPGQLHSDGGNLVVDTRTGRPIAEVERDELMLVMSRRATAANADLIPLLLEASRRGERLPVFTRPVPSFDFGGYRSNVQWERMALGGGITRGTALVNRADTGDTGGTTYTFAKSTGLAAPSGGTQGIEALLATLIERTEENIAATRQSRKVAFDQNYDRAQQRWQALKDQNTAKRRR